MAARRGLGPNDAVAAEPVAVSWLRHALVGSVEAS
jgi:hypothetical protein